MDWIKKNYAVVTIAIIIAGQLIIFGNMPKRVDSLEIRMSRIEITMNENLRDHATIIANQHNSGLLLQKLLELHTKP